VFRDQLYEFFFILRNDEVEVVIECEYCYDGGVVGCVDVLDGFGW